MQERDAKIDYIRTIGTVLVILAHMTLPRTINEIRTFDVVALVLISGLSINYQSKTSYKSYVFKRIKKLVFPTYFVISVVFFLSAIFCFLFRNNIQIFDIETILRSYMFAGGIGYIWIVKVYLVIALVLPVLNKIVSENNFKSLFWIQLIGLYILYDCMESNWGDNDILYEYFFQTFPYVLIATIGIYLSRNPSDVKPLFVVFTLIVILLTLYFGTFNPSDYKYPPKLFYISYGLSVGLGLFLLLPKKRNIAIEWISKNSFSIYLWHIVFLFFTNALSDIKNYGFINIWYIQFVVVLGLSIVFVGCQKYFINRFCKKRRTV